MKNTKKPSLNLKSKAEISSEKPSEAKIFEKPIEYSFVPKKVVSEGISASDFIVNLISELEESIKSYSKEQKEIVFPLIKSIANVYQKLAFSHGKVLVGHKKPHPTLEKELHHIRMQLKAIGLAEAELFNNKVNEIVQKTLMQGFKVAISLIL